MASNAIRIVVLDSYMSRPVQGLDVMYSEFRSSSVNTLPVLRCFGSTAEGKKICVHIHGVFPYFYIPYDGTGDSKTLMYQIASNIDKAVNISLNQASSNTQHVYKMSLVSGVPMYGYHSRNHQFFKIHLYNPMLLTRVCNLLKTDSILGKFYQPHESHINFTLQFMMDYNLHGMSTMLVTNMKYRVNRNDLNDDSIPKEHYLPPNVQRTSSCQLEADVLAENIVNREEIASGALGANPGIAALWEDERQRRRDKSETSQIGQFLELTRTNVPPTKSHLLFKRALLERLAILSTDKAVITETQNTSVYPAETPQDSNIQNASMLDVHLTDSSLDDSSLNMSLTPHDLDTTHSLEATFDENAMKLLQILEELGANVREEQDRAEITEENDSILSQTVMVEQDIERLEEGELDLSMPFEAVSTPQKLSNQVDDDFQGNDSSEDIFNTTVVPQLDGQTDLEKAKEFVNYNQKINRCLEVRKFCVVAENCKNKEIVLVPQVDGPSDTEEFKGLVGEIEKRINRNVDRILRSEGIGEKDNKNEEVSDDSYNWKGRLRSGRTINYNLSRISPNYLYNWKDRLTARQSESDLSFGGDKEPATKEYCGRIFESFALDHDYCRSPQKEFKLKSMFVKLERCDLDTLQTTQTFKSMPILNEYWKPDIEFKTEMEFKTEKESVNENTEPIVEVVQEIPKKKVDGCRKRKRTETPKRHRNVLKLLRHSKTGETDESIVNQIETLNKQLEKLTRINRIKKISRKIRITESHVCAFKQEIPKPRFNVISCDTYAMLHLNQNMTVIDHLLEQSHNYVDRNLRLFLKYPNSECFFYLYNGQKLPEVISVPPESNDRDFKFLWTSFKSPTVKAEFDDSNVSIKVEDDLDNDVKQSPQLVKTPIKSRTKSNPVVRTNQEKQSSEAISSKNTSQPLITANNSQKTVKSKPEIFGTNVDFKKTAVKTTKVVKNMVKKRTNSNPLNASKKSSTSLSKKPSEFHKNKDKLIKKTRNLPLNRPKIHESVKTQGGTKNQNVSSHSQGTSKEASKLAQEKLIHLEQHLNEYKLKPKPKSYETRSQYTVVDNYSGFRRRPRHTVCSNSVFENMQENIKILENKFIKPVKKNKTKLVNKILTESTFKLDSSYKIPKKKQTNVEHIPQECIDLPLRLFEPHLSDEECNFNNIQTKTTNPHSRIDNNLSPDVIVISSDEVNLNTHREERTISKHKKLKPRKNLDEIYYKRLKAVGLKDRALMLKAYRKKEKQLKHKKSHLKLKMNEVVNKESGNSITEVGEIPKVIDQKNNQIITVRKAEVCENNNIKITVSNIVPLTQKVGGNECVVNNENASEEKIKKQGTKRVGQNDTLTANVGQVEKTVKRIKLNRDIFKKPCAQAIENQNTLNHNPNRSNFYIFSEKYLNGGRNQKYSCSTKDLQQELNNDLDSHKRFLKAVENFPGNNQNLLIIRDRNDNVIESDNDSFKDDSRKHSKSECHYSTDTTSFDFLTEIKNDIFSRDTEAANSNTNVTDSDRTSLGNHHCRTKVDTKNVLSIHLNDVSDVKLEYLSSEKSEVFLSAKSNLEDGDTRESLDVNPNDVSDFEPRRRLYSDKSNEMMYGRRNIDDSGFVADTSEISGMHMQDVSSLKLKGRLSVDASRILMSKGQLLMEKGVQTDRTEIFSIKKRSGDLETCDTNTNALIHCDNLKQTKGFGDSSSSIKNVLTLEEVQVKLFGDGSHGLGDNPTGILQENYDFIDALNLEVLSPSFGLKKRRIVLKRTLIPALDGTYDTDSSEDSGKTSPKNKRKRKNISKFSSQKNQSKYKPLSIHTVSSPRKSEKSIGSHKKQPQHSVNEIVEQSKHIEKNTQPKSKTASDIDAVKRKIDFPDLNPLISNTSLIEENISCTYSPRKVDSICSAFSQKKAAKKNLETKSKDNERETIISGNFEISTVSSQDCNTSITPNIDLRLNSDEDIFSNSDSEDNINTSYLIDRLNMTVAEIYDLKTNYKPKEGCSTVFTPEDIKLLPLSPSKYTQKSSSEDLEPINKPRKDLLTETMCPLSLSGAKSDQSSSLDFLTPYQKDPTEQNVLSTVPDDEECLDETLVESDLDTTLKSNLTISQPEFKPPTFEEIQNSLDQYNIPHVRQQEPFYSNPEDVTGPVEVGFNILKISSKTTAHLAEFESQNDSLNTLRKKIVEQTANLKWNTNNLKHLKLSYCPHKIVVITPIARPPSYQEVVSWLEEKNSKIESITPERTKPERIKIHVPLSPSADENEDMDISLSISPCGTPDVVRKSSQAETDRSSSPILDKSKKFKQLNANRKKLFDKNTVELTQDSSRLNQSCQITGVTANNSFGFNRSVENFQKARAVVNYQYLTTMAMELHIRTRGDFKPNPEYDSIRAIFYSILNDVPDDFCKTKTSKGVLAMNSLPVSPGTPLTSILDGITSDSVEITYVDSEENLINEFVKLLERFDPDILAGYEIQMLSWGYLVERASYLSINLLPQLGRSKVSDKLWREKDETDLEKVTGRIMLDVWRLMRHEIALQSYTFESVVYHILHKRVAMYSFKDLSFWWDHRTMLHRHRTVNYYLYRVDSILELFDKLDLINRTSELARLFGIQFYEVLSRGSQFRVESMMLRLAKPLNFIPVSPSVQQRANMRAPEYIPLVMEPESKFYTDPVIVLDFQSLYPSIIIAYNYCFTTCIGRVECLGKNSPFDFGATQLKISPRRVKQLVKNDLLNFSPCGVAFVKNKIRDGILPRMLREILDTRLMVKSAMKENKNDEVLQKVLHSRQLGLKLIANVTYGYTAANFSGRMCCVEVGDSVVSKGRETLQRAIAMVDGTPEWGARVVYGDTDSLFVMVPGKTRETAFEIGKKIAQAVTDDNPDPIKLKLEKVYQPCILQTKKRYVGYMYESADQKAPVYDAKGIETVRRDGCPAVAKMLEKCLRILFEEKDISLIKKYVLRQFNKIMAGRVSIQDLTFAKEYRGFSGYKPGACVPSLELARKWTATDKRSEPRCGERVPYVIINGPPGLPLIRLVRSPRDLLADPALRPNALYYITKVIIPPLNRCFNLIGADLNQWFNQMPRKQIQYLPNSCSPGSGRKSTISQYFATTSCASCSEQTQSGLCEKCVRKSQVTVVTLMEKLRNWEQNYHDVTKICHCCTGSSSDNIECISLDCPVLYRRTQTQRDLKQSAYVRQLVTANFQLENFF